MRSPKIARGALVFLFFAAIAIGLTAAVVPRTFYDDFPFLAHWVELLPPYNEHLVTDVGSLYLGFAVLFAWAAWTLDRTLVRAVSVAWLLSASIHLLFHAGHLEGFGTADWSLPRWPPGRSNRRRPARPRPPAPTPARILSPRRGAGAVERGSLENCWRRKALVGSNPTPSARLAALVRDAQLGFCQHPGEVSEWLKERDWKSRGRG
jgi:hypothetical protein